MTKLYAPLLGLALTAATVAHAQDDDTSEAMFMLPIADISIEGDTIIYDGSISDESWRLLAKLAKTEAAQDVTRMVITSGGGETIAGREIGRWVHENISVLEVRDMCFSSCANYVFTAAPSVVIQEGGFIGWHGNERTIEVMAQSQPGVDWREEERQALRAALIQSAPELAGTEDLEAIIETEMARADEARAEEAVFFNDIGVDENIALYGLLPANLATYEASGMGGWTYSIEDMAKFGRDNVTYAGEGEYHTSFSVRSFVHLFAVTD